LRAERDQLDLLSGQGAISEIKPSQVQFELLRQHIAASNVALDLAKAGETLTLNLQFSGQ
jgi:hypothetical protein